MDKKKVQVMFSQKEGLLTFDSYYDVVAYMRMKAIPWDSVKAKSNMDYKKRVRGRVKVMHGKKAYTNFEVYDDKGFVMNLLELKEVMEVNEI